MREAQSAGADVWFPVESPEGGPTYFDPILPLDGDQDIPES
jgi:hypothetical protein